tara:strand:+ start:7188 stop:8660 length:1473 start_codon:yes stop_codon:yes gene_type:complete
LTVLTIPNIITRFIGNKQNNYILIFSFLVLIYPLFYVVKTNMQNFFLIKIAENIRNLYITELFNIYTGKKELNEAESQFYYNEVFYQYMHFIKVFVEKILPFAITFILVIIYFLRINMASIIILFHLLSIFILLYIFIKPISKVAKKFFIKSIESQSYYVDRIKNIFNIIFDDNQNEEIINISKKQDSTNNAMFNHYLKSTNLAGIGYLLNYLTFFLILYLIKKQNYSWELKSSYLFIMFIYVTIANDCYSEIPMQSRILGFMNRFNKHLETEFPDFIKCNNKNFDKIVVKDLVFSYNNNIIINKLNFTINNNELNVIVGQTGSGKTTLAKLLIKALTPTSGIIYYGSYPHTKMCTKDIRDVIYYVNQRTKLFNMSILYNLQYGNNYSQEKIKSFLKKYKLMSIFQNGLHINVGVNGSNISLGMQKVITVVRGCFKKQKIIIFDEPTASLDINTQKKILNFLLEYSKKKTFIIISHDKIVSEQASNIIQL